MKARKLKIINLVLICNYLLLRKAKKLEVVIPLAWDTLFWLREYYKVKNQPEYPKGLAIGGESSGKEPILKP